MVFLWCFATSHVKSEDKYCNVLSVMLNKITKEWYCCGQYQKVFTTRERTWKQLFCFLVSGVEFAEVETCMSYFDVVSLQSLQDLRKKDDKVRLIGQHIVGRIPATERKGKPYRKCRVCLKRGMRRETQKHCTSCPSKPALCVPHCFEDFHSKLVYW